MKENLLDFKTFLGIISFFMAWLLYLFIPPFFTFFILLLHYLAFFLLSFNIYALKSKYQALILTLIYFFSLLMDFFFYDPIHNISYTFSYYFFLNLVHLSVCLLFLSYHSNKPLLTLSILLFTALSIYIWIFHMNLLYISAIYNISLLIAYFYISKKKKIFTFEFNS